MHPGRNDPCPCGSGKKYKKCCGATERAEADPRVATASAAHDADARLNLRLLRFIRARMGADWLADTMDAYTGDPGEQIGEAELQLAIPWAMYSAAAGGGVPVAELFREDHSSGLTPEVRHVLDAHLRAWLSIWDVLRVEPGVGVAVADLLSGEKRFVHEISGSKVLGARDVVLGRVLDLGSISIFGGLHPQPLAPGKADMIVREIRRLNHVRTRPVKPEQLRQPDIEIAMIDMWRDVAEQQLTRPAPQITNTDGDPLLLTTDHFDIAGADHAELLARIATFSGAEEPVPDESGSEDVTVTITKPGNAQMKSWDNTVIGRIVIRANRMRVETNSTRRADALRAALTEHLGALVQYRIREETAQEELMRQARTPRKRDVPARDTTPEMAAVMKAFKEQHMLGWLDDEIPALGGLTPREASKSPSTRKTLELLLRDFENHEGRLPENERFDIDRLRIALGIKEG